MFKVSCIKCRQKYNSDEPDDFYCPECDVIRKEIAKKIDEQIAGRPKKNRQSLLQSYDSRRKIRGFISAQELLGL